MARVRLLFSPQKQWKAKGDTSQNFREHELESLKGIFLEEERVHLISRFASFNDNYGFFLMIKLRLLYSVPLNLKTVCHLKSDSSTVFAALSMLRGCFV